MIGLQISAKDVKAGKIVKPGWYGTKITDLRNEIGPDKESDNFIVEVEGLEGDAKGVPSRAQFSEKFPQAAVPYINATGKTMGIEIPTDDEKGLDPRYRWEAAKGLIVYCNWSTWRGKDGTERPRNNIVDWAPLPSNHELADMNVEMAASQASQFGASASKFQG